MAQFIEKPTVIKAEGVPVKLIEEYFGRVNSQDNQISVAKMKSPTGWAEPGQRPDFAEYTVVLAGCLKVELSDQVLNVKAGQGIMIPAGEWVRYSSPFDGGAEYIAVCIPAFSPQTVHRDNE